MPANFRRRAAKRSASFAPRALPRPLSGAVVDAVLRYSDVAEDLGGGRTLRRISPARLHEAEVQAALGDAADRAGGVSILWNEREGEIIRVMEGQARALAA